MRRYVVGGVLGYLTVIVAMAYIALIAAVKGPIDWPTLAQGTLFFGPFGSLCGAVLAGFPQ